MTIHQQVWISAYNAAASSGKNYGECKVIADACLTDFKVRFG